MMQKGNLLGIVLWVCKHVFCTYQYTLGYYWYKSEKLCFEPSQIGTVTNCDNSGIPAVAICDLSQFVIKAVTAQTEFSNTENVFWVLLRVPRFTFDMNMKSCIFTHLSLISLVYMFVCMHISYKAHNRCIKETFLIGSNVDVNICSALRSIPYGTIDINLKSCILIRHKLRQSQIATLSSQFVICRNLWSRPWRGHIDSNNTENMLWVLWRVPMFTFDMNMKSFIFADSGVISLVHLFVCISVIMTINDVPKKLS